MRKFLNLIYMRFRIGVFSQAGNFVFELATKRKMAEVLPGFRFIHENSSNRFAWERCSHNTQNPNIDFRSCRINDIPHFRFGGNFMETCWRFHSSPDNSARNDLIPGYCLIFVIKETFFPQVFFLSLLSLTFHELIWDVSISL